MTKGKVYLLDCNVLIALATPEHSLNTRAAVWFRKGYRFATCPITQGALFRFHLRAGVEASQATIEAAKAAIVAAEAAVDDAQVKLGFTSIVSPIDGIAGLLVLREQHKFRLFAPASIMAVSCCASSPTSPLSPLPTCWSFWQRRAAWRSAWEGRCWRG